MKLSEELKSVKYCEDWVIKKVEEMENAVNKMKCCSNCLYRTSIAIGMSKKQIESSQCYACYQLSEWELEE